MEGSTTTSKWTLDGYSMDDIINKLSKRMSSASNKNKPVIVYVDQSGALKATGSGEKVPALSLIHISLVLPERRSPDVRCESMR